MNFVNIHILTELDWIFFLVIYKFYLHCKNSFLKIQIICLYKDVTLQYKGDSDSFIKSKNFNISFIKLFKSPL